jgi:hypothetical protein
MCYQMGCNKTATFKKALKNMYDENWKEAAKEMIDSDWHKQTKNRAEDHAKVMESGECEVYCKLDGWG